MALPTTPTYSTFAEFQANTPSQSTQGASGTLSLSEPDWTPYALRAQYMIDAFVNNNIPPYDEDQVWLFPTIDEDGDSWTPKEVSIAHIELTSALIDQGDPVTSGGTGGAGGGKLSESWSGSGYAYTAGGKRDLDSQKLNLPSIVVRLLAPWSAKYGRLTY